MTVVIKAYTDLKQSKRLAEILSHKTANNTYERVVISGCNLDIPEEQQYIHRDIPFTYFSGVGIPCWSLAALLSVLPTYLFEFDRGIDLNVYPNLNGRGWHCSYMPNCIENMKTDKFKLITSGDSLVDACVTMIESLHELKIL